MPRETNGEHSTSQPRSVCVASAYPNQEDGRTMLEQLRVSRPDRYATEGRSGLLPFGKTVVTVRDYLPTMTSEALMIA
jgi:hypothetical protein